VGTKSNADVYPRNHRCVHAAGAGTQFRSTPSYACSCIKLFWIFIIYACIRRIIWKCSKSRTVWKCACSSNGIIWKRSYTGPNDGSVWKQQYDTGSSDGIIR
jgi:hypothetical protein